MDDVQKDKSDRNLQDVQASQRTEPQVLEQPADTADEHSEKTAGPFDVLSVSEDLLIKYVNEGNSEPGITVSIFDCGGQDVFRDLHDIFQFGHSAFLVVFALPDVLQDETRQRCIDSVRRQLDSISVHCSDLKVLLVGTSAGKLDASEQQVATKKLGPQC